MRNTIFIFLVSVAVSCSQPAPPAQKEQLQPVAVNVGDITVELQKNAPGENILRIDSITDRKEENTVITYVTYHTSHGLRRFALKDRFEYRRGSCLSATGKPVDMVSRIDDEGLVSIWALDTTCTLVLNR